MTIDQLQQNLSKAERALSAISSDREREKQRRLKAVDKALDEMFGASKAEAIEVVRVAQDAYDTACEENPLPHKRFKVGQALVEWKFPGSAWSTDRRRTPQRKGIVQVFKRGDMLPGNTGSYSTPTPGTIIVRPLRKDGSPGKAVAQWLDDWHPVGVDPNKAQP